MTASPLITLLSDFGTRDGYVGAMKGIIFGQCPRARVVDVAHDVTPHDIRSAAWVLRQFSSCFPAGTIHVAVVDPGVGTERAALAVEAGGQRWLAPDNGILGWILTQNPNARVGRLKRGVVRPEGLSTTFHGRDIFAYAAGLLGKGVRWDRLVKPADSWNQPDWLCPVIHGRSVQGEVVHVDRFGNLITNISESIIRERAHSIRIRLGSRTIRGISRTYADVAPGRLVAVIGSDGMLELAVNQGNASMLTRCRPGSRIEVS